MEKKGTGALPLIKISPEKSVPGRGKVAIWGRPELFSYSLVDLGKRCKVKDWEHKAQGKKCLSVANSGTEILVKRRS